MDKTYNSIGLITAHTCFLGGHDSTSPQREKCLAKITNIIENLNLESKPTFNLPVLNGLPIDVASFILDKKLWYNAWIPFGKYEEYYNKIPYVLPHLMQMLDNANELFYPNGENPRYSPLRVLKCYKQIVKNSQMIIVVGNSHIHDYWAPRLRNKYSVFIDVTNEM